MSFSVEISHHIQSHIWHHIYIILEDETELFVLDESIDPLLGLTREGVSHSIDLNEELAFWGWYMTLPAMVNYNSGHKLHGS